MPMQSLRSTARLSDAANDNDNDDDNCDFIVVDHSLNGSSGSVNGDLQFLWG